MTGSNWSEYGKCKPIFLKVLSLKVKSQDIMLELNEDDVCKEKWLI